MAGTALKRLMAEYKRESRGVPGGSGHSSPPSSPPRQGVPPPRHRAGRAGPPRAQRRARPGSASPGLSSSAVLRKPRTGRVWGGGGTVLLFIFIYFLLLTWSCLVKNRTGCGSQTKCGVSAAGGPPAPRQREQGACCCSCCSCSCSCSYSCSYFCSCSCYWVPRGWGPLGALPLARAVCSPVPLQGARR